MNHDETVDVYFGPEAVAGMATNFIETGDCETFELMFRFYGVGPEVTTSNGSSRTPSSSTGTSSDHPPPTPPSAHG